MVGQHIALIIEDEPEMAAEIADLVRSFGHSSICAENKADALALIENSHFCYVLLDMQIKADRDSIKAYVSAGMNLLEEIRRKFPHRAQSDMHLLPVLVVSGQAKEHDDVVRALQIGADDFIRKPLSFDGQVFGTKIRRCLDGAGRGDHGECDACAAAAANGCSAPAANDEAFWHLPDYSEVKLHGVLYLFTGDIQKKVIRLLHEATKVDQPWQGGQLVLGQAGSRDTRMVNLFGCHPCWGNILLSDKRGKYRLRTE